MASTFSPSLKLELIGDGDQSGIWGQTTNNNLGTLLEQAIAGVVSFDMLDGNYTLTNFNGVSDEARNMVLVATGANSAVRDIIPPLVEKVYIVKNSTTGGYGVRVIGSSGTGVTVFSGATVIVYCDGTNFYAVNNESVGNFTVNGTLDVTGTTTLNAALIYGGVTLSNAVTGTGNMVLSASPTFTGTPISTTAANGTNTTQIATTAFVNAAVTTGLGTLGTMSTQNANAVTITGGTLNGVTGTNAGLTVGTATNATNATTSTTQAAGTNNTSIATTAFVQAATFGSASQTWQNVTGSRVFGGTYSNTTGRAISVSVWGGFPPGTSLTGVVDGVPAVFTGSRANTEEDFITFIVPNGANYYVQQNGGVMYNYTWVELR
jgi:hypothetical protein